MNFLNRNFTQTFHVGNSKGKTKRDRGEIFASDSFLHFKEHLIEFQLQNARNKMKRVL